MNWNDLVANGLILQLLNQRTFRTAMQRRGLDAMKPQLADLRQGRFVIDGQDLGLAQPVMTLAPGAKSGQWWWDSKAASPATTEVVEAVRSAGQGCSEIERGVVAFADLWPGSEGGAGSVMKVASCVAGVCTALIAGPVFFPIHAGKAILVIAVQPDEPVSVSYDDEDVSAAVSYATWLPIDAETLSEAARAQIVSAR